MTESAVARQHALEMHVQPARNRKIQFIELKAGDIQKELGWRARYRQIIAALWADEFEELARVRNLDKPGNRPRENSTVVLRFEVLDREQARQIEVSSLIGAEDESERNRTSICPGELRPSGA